MKAFLLKALALLLIGCVTEMAHAADGCSYKRSAIGAVIGGLLGTLVFPGVGTAWGAALGAGGTCTVDEWRADAEPPAAPAALDAQDKRIPDARRS